MSIEGYHVQEEPRRREILTRIEFCNGMIHYAIALAGLMIAGLGGIFAGKEALKNVNFEFMVALFSLGSGLAFQLLNLILAQEEWLIRKVNKSLGSPVVLVSALLDAKFIFITAMAVAFPLFAWWYLRDVKVPQWLLNNGGLCALWVLNLAVLIPVLILRLGCSPPRGFSQRLTSLLRRAWDKLNVSRSAKKGDSR